MSTDAVLATLLTASAAWCATSMPGAARRAVSLSAARSRSDTHRVPGRATADWAHLPLSRGSSAIAGLAIGSATVVGTGSVAGSVVAAATAVAAERAARARAANRAERAGRDQVRLVLRGLAVELRSGSPPPAAFRRCWPSAGAASALLVEDVPAYLRAAATAPGRSGLRRLAALWVVADTTGAGLADGVERLCDEIDEEVELRRELDAVLAGPRSSARLMAGLPVAGVLLGSGLGGDPVGFLLHDPLGQACLVGGAALVAAGLRWTRALATAAAGAPR